MNNNLWPNAIPMLLSVAPLLLVWLGGIVLAVINWQRCPTSSLLVVLAMLDLVLFRIANSLVITFAFPMMRENWGWNHQQVAQVLAVNGYVSTVGGIIGFVLLLAAVYIGRPGSRTPESYGQFPPK